MFDRTVDRLLPRVAPQSAQLGGEVEEAVHSHVGVARRVLGQVADQPLRRQRVLQHVVAADRDPSRGRRDEPGDHAHGGGLAGAVGPEEAQHFAALDRERDVVHRELRAERLHQVLDFDHSRSTSGRADFAALFFCTLNHVRLRGFQEGRRMSPGSRAVGPGDSKRFPQVTGSVAICSPHYSESAGQRCRPVSLLVPTV